jgi:hypothetical protein
MIKKLWPLPLLLVLFSCEELEECNKQFIVDHHNLKKSFQTAVAANATIEDRNNLKDNLSSFIQKHKGVKCTSGELTLDPSKEVQELINELNVKNTATSEVVYGEDNRVDIVDSKNTNHIRWSKSAAAQIQNFKIDENLNLDSRTLGEHEKLCKGERFFDQINPAYCSGFLVGEDILVTAGHCMTSELDCNEKSWVFDFVKGTKKLKAQNIYKCSEIISQAHDRQSMNDYAVIRLDRPVIDRPYLKFRTSGKISDNQSILVIGHPSGLPLKIADGAIVRKNTDDVFFETNLDTFHVNSGSPVLDSTTGLVEGILVRGEADYKWIDDGQGGRCKTVNTCKDDECRGEDVTRITTVTDLPDQKLLNPQEIKESLFVKNDLSKESTSGLIPFYFQTNNDHVISGRKFLDVCTLHVSSLATPKFWSHEFTGQCNDSKIMNIIDLFVLY